MSSIASATSIMVSKTSASKSGPSQRQIITNPSLPNVALNSAYTAASVGSLPCHRSSRLSTVTRLTTRRAGMAATNRRTAARSRIFTMPRDDGPGERPHQRRGWRAGVWSPEFRGSGRRGRGRPPTPGPFAAAAGDALRQKGRGWSRIRASRRSRRWAAA